MRNDKQTIYAMVGTIGSGKTTYAKNISEEKSAMFFSIDKHIKLLGQPIESHEDYDRYYFGVRDVISKYAQQVLSLGHSVVFDFGGSVGHWDWLKSLAEKTNSKIEIFHLMAPFEVRRQRVKARNLDPETIFHFSDEEFKAMPQESAAPQVNWPDLKITIVNTEM